MKPKTIDLEEFNAIFEKAQSFFNFEHEQTPVLQYDAFKRVNLSTHMSSKLESRRWHRVLDSDVFEIDKTRNEKDLFGAMLSQVFDITVVGAVKRYRDSNGNYSE